MIFVVAFVLGALSVALCLGQMIEPIRLRELGRRIRYPRFTIRQLMIAVAAVALLLFVFGGPPTDEKAFALALLAMGALVWLVRAWQKEFVFLMGLRDDELPGRHDKIIWAVTLLVLAPIGVWFFRAYRLAHWPEPVPAAEGKGWAGEADGAAQLA